VYTVKLIIDSDNNDYLTGYVRAKTPQGSAYPWEPVTLSTDYTMSNIDEQLEYRLDCSGGTAIITRVRIDYT